MDPEKIKELDDMACDELNELYLFRPVIETPRGKVILVYSREKREHYLIYDQESGHPLNAPKLLKHILSGLFR